MSLLRRAYRSPWTPSLASSSRLFSSSSFCAPAGATKLFVAGLSYSVDERSLRDAFSSFGSVTEVRIMYDKNTGRSRGFGFVNFLSEEDANCAKGAMDGKVLLGRPLQISYALEKVPNGPVVPRHPLAGNSSHTQRR